MAIEIVQLGHFPFRGVPSSLGDLTFDTSLKWRSQADTLTHVSGIVSHGVNGYPLTDDRKWKIQGSLLCTEGDGCEDSWHSFNRIHSLAGSPFHLIGVRDMESCYCPKCGACSGNGCDYCGSRKYAEWLTISVELLSSKRVFNWQNGQHIPYNHIGVEIEVRPLQPYWEPMDNLRWRYYHRAQPIFHNVMPNPTTNPVKYYHPKRVPREPHPQAGFTYLDSRYPEEMGVLMFPENWVTAYEDTYGGMFKRAAFNEFLYYRSPTTHTFVADPHMWSAPSRSLYSLEGLFDTGTVEITVEGVTPAGHKVRNSASLDMSVISDMMFALHGGMIPEDYILVGDFPQSSLYIRGRDKEVLDMYLPWEFDGPYPGYTYPGENTVTLGGDGLNFYRYLHVFRSH